MAATSIAKIISDRAGFMGSTIGVMLFQLCLTFAVFMYVRQNHPEVAKGVTTTFYAALIMGFVLVLCMVYVPMPPWLKFILFVMFAACQGVTLGALGAVPTEILKAALLSTIGVFVTMFVVGLALTYAGADLGFMGIILAGLLIGIIVMRVVMIFVSISNATHKALLYVTLAVFSAYIAFETNQLLLSDTEDVVDAALGYYLDILNLFMSFVDLATLQE